MRQTIKMEIEIPVKAGCYDEDFIIVDGIDLVPDMNANEKIAIFLALDLLVGYRDDHERIEGEISDDTLLDLIDENPEEFPDG